MGSYLLFLSYFVWTQVKPDIVPALIFDTLMILKKKKKKKKKKNKKNKKKNKKKKQCAELPQSCLYMQINAFAHFDTYYEKINPLIEKIKGDSVSTND